MSHANIVEFRALSKSADGTLCLSMENGQRSLMDMIDSRKETGKGLRRADAGRRPSHA